MGKYTINFITSLQNSGAINLWCVKEIESNTLMRFNVFK